jgi:signal recognition particle receptor subunit beta
MAIINEVNGDILIKIVYAGISGSGKSTNLQSIYKQTSSDVSSRFFDLHGLETRHPYFDFLPLACSHIRSQNVRLHLYTLPALDLWDTLARQLLRGIDGLVWVVDSRVENLERNEDHLEKLSKQLNDVGTGIGNHATVIQFNHRDSERAASIGALKAAFQLRGAMQIDSIAVQDIGVLETLNALCELVLGRMDSLPIHHDRLELRSRNFGANGHQGSMLGDAP